MENISLPNIELFLNEIISPFPFFYFSKYSEFNTATDDITKRNIDFHQQLSLWTEQRSLWRSFMDFMAYFNRI